MCSVLCSDEVPHVEIPEHKDDHKGDENIKEDIATEHNVSSDS